MRLTRKDKKALVEGVRERFEKARATFLSDYTGVKAEEMTGLRRTLKKADSEFKIVRNTLARLAVKGTGYDFLCEHFQGPVAITFSYNDAVMTAKTLTEFARTNPNLRLKVGTLGTRIIAPEEIRSLAELPSREALLARCIGVLKAVPGGFVGVLSGVPRKLLYALNALQDKKKTS